MERISHFEIVRRLGRGGMGEVFEANDLDLGRRVALKFVAAHFANDPEALRRFEREARVAASLHHPRIATLFAFDRSTERPFLVMELLGGRTLRDVVAGGPLPVADALGIAREVADALAYAHRRGVVHRDIKPENLMFDADGAIKITDFGLARLADASRLTTTGSTFGTAAYMAPELMHGTAPAEAEAATVETSPADVFALGVALYEMLAGAQPFRGENALATLYAIANTPAPALRDSRPEVAPEVEALVARMLAKDPAARPTAADVVVELGRLTGVAPTGGWSFATGRGGFPSAGQDSSAVTLPVEHLQAGADPARLPATIARGDRGGARGADVRNVVLLLIVALGVGGWFWFRATHTAPDARAVALNNSGHDLLAAGNLGPARSQLEAALAAAPRYTEAKLNLATVLHRQGEDDRAAALYGEVIRENASHPAWAAAAHYGLGEIDLQANAWPSAVEHLSAAAARDSSRVEYPNNLGFALIQAGRTDDALRTLRAAESRFPGEASLLKNVALAWYKSGRPDSALVAASAAVRLKPDFAAAWLIKLESEAARGDEAAARASRVALLPLASKQTLDEAEAALKSAFPGGRVR